MVVFFVKTGSFHVAKSGSFHVALTCIGFVNQCIRVAV
jgi:hypothetical protein